MKTLGLGMRAVAQQLRSDEARAAEADRVRYVELLNETTPTGPEQEELIEVSRRLGKTGDDVLADIAVIEQAIKEEQVIRDGSDLTAALEQNAKAKVAHNAEYDRIEEERRTKGLALENEGRRLHQLKVAGRNAHGRLTELRSGRPDLLKDRPALLNPM